VLIPPVVSEQPRRCAEGTLLKYIVVDGDRLPDLVATISELRHCPTFAASELWYRSEISRGASSGHAFALGDDWIVPSADYRAAVLDLPPRMARCASKSFATSQSCFISIKVVAVGQQTGTNVDCINTEFVGFLALVGFAWRKK
jgi:hypothetical protein